MTASVDANKLGHGEREYLAVYQIIGTTLLIYRTAKLREADLLIHALTKCRFAVAHSSVSQ